MARCCAYLVLLLAVSRYTYATSVKTLDAFTSTAAYYTAGSGGTVTASINSTTYTEGNSSLQLSYTLNGTSGNYVECFRSYSTNTVDLSYLPDKLSIQVKGSAGNTDQFQFMLFEDINMDGNPFEASDAIWVFSDPTILSQPNWTLLDMPYSSFTLFGGGTATMRLDRIGAWQIFLTNTGVSSSQTVYFDALEQITDNVFPANVHASLTGSFVQLWNTAGCYCGQWTQAQWATQMQDMKNVGLNKLVVQYGVYSNNAWYSPSSLSFVQYTNPTLTNILNAAQQQGIAVYIGLYYDETWNTVDMSQPSTYSTLLTMHQQVADELWNLYSTASAFTGWYIPQEVNDLQWKSVANQTLLANWLQAVSSYLKTKSATKKVMIAPYFGPNMPADTLGTWWETVLKVATNIDEVYPQDGVGTTRTVVDVDVPNYFNAIKTACVNTGRTFGATIESFQQTNGWPINSNAATYIPATVTRLDSQLVEASLYTTNLIQFDWSYMEPSLSTASQQLYNDYAALNTTVTGVSQNAVPTSKDLYPNPSASSEPVYVADALVGSDYALYDGVGKLLMSGIITDNTIEFNGEYKGILLMKVMQNDLVTTYKISKY